MFPDIVYTCSGIAPELRNEGYPIDIIQDDTDL